MRLKKYIHISLNKKDISMTDYVVQTEKHARRRILSWDLPPYKSDSFNDSFPNLEEFKQLPIYDAAVRAGLIVDDEWVGPPEGYCAIVKFKKRNKNDS
jgi:hypothetical protein